jgi:hypothetical protein
LFCAEAAGGGSSMDVNVEMGQGTCEGLQLREVDRVGVLTNRPDQPDVVGGVVFVCAR